MDKFILAPGPTQAKQELLDILSEPVLYHRSANFHSLYEKTRGQLKTMMGLDGGEALILTSSGTGVMEAAVANFFSPHDPVLVISVGHFGHRFTEICATYHLDITMLDYPLGETYDYHEVKAYIVNHPELKGVFITHHETSSGVLNQLAPIGDLVKELPQCLLIVDAISGFLIHEMKMSAWHIDVLLASSQKGFLIPPGLAIAGLSDKALKLLSRGTLPCYYMDMKKYLAVIPENETPFTPNTSLLKALSAACDYLLDYGLERYYRHHYELRVYLEEKLEALGLDTRVVKEENKGNVLALVALPEGVDARVIHDRLDEEGFIVATGFGENKARMLRIGVIGEVHHADLDRFIETLKKVLS